MVMRSRSSGLRAPRRVSTRSREAAAFEGPAKPEGPAAADEPGVSEFEARFSSSSA